MTYIDTKKLTIPKTIQTPTDLVLFINKRYQLVYQKDYYFKDRITHRCYYSSKFPEGFNSLSSLELIFKVNGGGFVDIILKPLEIIFKPIIEPIVGIGKAFLLFLKIILWLLQFLLWILRLAIWVLSAFIPSLLRDFSGIIKTIIMVIFDSTFGLIIKIIKRIFGSGIPKDKRNSPEYRCYGPKDDGTLPTTILISTILCPPLGVFMVYGASGWMYILGSAVLSLFYYFPGLIYSLVLFYT